MVTYLLVGDGPSKWMVPLAFAAITLAFVGALLTVPTGPPPP
jgi:hypothetical protein